MPVLLTDTEKQSDMSTIAPRTMPVLLSDTEKQSDR